MSEDENRREDDGDPKLNKEFRLAEKQYYTDRPYYAKTNAHIIEPILAGSAIYSTVEEARALLGRIRSSFTCKKRLQNEIRINNEFLFIRDYDLSDSEINLQKAGNYAELFIEPRGGSYIINHRKIIRSGWGSPIASKGLIKQNAPPWTIDTLKTIKKQGRKYCNSIDEARTELSILVETYKTVLWRSDNKVTAYVWRRGEGGKVFHDHIEIRIGIDEADKPYLYIVDGYKRKQSQDIKLTALERREINHLYIKDSALKVFGDRGEEHNEIANIVMENLLTWEGRARFKKLGVNEHDIIYHFTGRGAFEKILKDQTLWMFDMNTMNDMTEIVHGHSTIINFLENADLHFGALKDEWVDKFKVSLEWEFTRNSGAMPMFGTCFTDTESNSLQWQSYGRKGSGVAMGFDRKKLSSACDGAGIQLRKAHYFNERKDQLLSSILKEIVDNAKLKAASPAVAAQKTGDILKIISPIFKNKSFSAESEWRMLLAFDPADSRWIEDSCEKGEKKLSAGYVPLKFDAIFEAPMKDFLSEVVVGYADNPRDNRTYAEGVLRRSGYLNTTVRISSVPIGNF